MIVGEKPESNRAGNTRRRRQLLSGFFLIPLLVFVSRVAHADSVKYLGIELPIESVVAVQDEQSKLTIAGKAYLVPAQDVGRKVASVYASDSELLQRELKWETISQFVRTTVEKDEQIAVSLFSTLFRATKLPSAQLGDLLSDLAEQPGKARLLEEAIQNFDTPLPSPSNLCEGFVAVSSLFRKLLLERSPRLVYRYQYQCTEYLEKSAQQRLSLGDVERGIKTLDAITQLFADGGATYLPLISARARLSKLQAAISSGDYLSVVRLVRTLNEDPWLAPFSINVGRSVVQIAIDAALKDGKIGDALRLIPAIDYQRRTPRDHQLVIRTLEGVSIAERDILISDSVTTILMAIARKDPGVSTAYVAALERVTNVLLEGTNFTAVEGVLHRLFSLRPDPSKDNDEIRKKLIIKLLDAGLVPQAKSVASELSTTASPLLQIKLILAGAYVEFGVLIALTLVVILGGTFLLWGRRAVRPTSTSKNSRERATSSQQQFVDEDEPEQPRRFVVYSHGIKVGQGVDEYTECLRVFALKPGASLKKIKVAYRNAVKACHPDLNPNAGPQEAARFIQLTKSYERLLQLHEQRTGER